VNAPSFQRPIGFAPSEISGLVNESVVAQHAEEAAFLWTMRDRAIEEPHYSVQDLAALDERVEGHLDGLRISGHTGWKYCRSNLEHLGPGEVFALSVMAFGVEDRDWMRAALEAGCSSPKALPGLVSALGWLDFASVAPWIHRLLEGRSPTHRAVGLAASAIHRRDPGAGLEGAVNDSDPALCARALRAVGELKRRDLSSLVRSRLRSDEETTRFWAAWALTLNRESGGLVELTRWFERPDSFGVRALQTGLRAMTLDESRNWISSLVQKPDLGRSAVIGVGIVGDATSVPWLIRKMSSPELARLAGEAFMMITGVDLAYHDLNQDPPPSADQETIEEILALDYESNLPWPSPERIADWWQQNQNAFVPGIRYLAGKPVTEQSLRHVLVAGKQRQRAAAALELALLNLDETLFEVRSRGQRQQQMMASWNS
jgi:uncharacterized protein (TIGR02270 family)